MKKTEEIKNQPWYKEYESVLEKEKVNDTETKSLQEREKKLKQITTFYKDIGAEYYKNGLLKREKIDIIVAVMKNAVENRDDESIVMLTTYMDDEEFEEYEKYKKYKLLAKQIWDYLNSVN